MEDDAARELLQQLKALHYLEDNTAPTRWHRCLITLSTETNAIVLEPLPSHLFFFGGGVCPNSVGGFNREETEEKKKTLILNHIKTALYAEACISSWFMIYDPATDLTLDPS